MIAIPNGGVNWVHQDPVTKSQRLTNIMGTIVAMIDLDPWGGSTNRNSNDVFSNSSAAIASPGFEVGFLP